MCWRQIVVVLLGFSGVCGAEALWSLKPLNPSALKHKSIDAYLAETRNAAGLEGSPRADRRTLIRRASFDLTGLPPSPSEVDAFVKDDSVDAWPRLVNRLLSSPHYGEQWARHWLDLARYSDTKGYVYAREEKRWVHAWVYRDWVVRALNDDMPYDRFVKLQIAADQMVPEGSPDLAAMGFLALGRRFLGVTHDIIDDRIDVVTRGVLGLTVACARCHDHKFDPIPTKDYYSLYGVFQSCAEKLVPCGPVTDRAFEEELHKRQTTLAETMSKRREEQSARVRHRLADHLMAQLELDKYPEEVFGQLLEEKDLNPFVVRKWQAYLRSDSTAEHPVFAEWHAKIKTASMQQMQSLADRYAAQFASVDKDRSEPRLRAVLYGPSSPCYVPDEHIANNEMYFPVGVVTELWKLQGEVDRWLMQGGEKARFATVLVDREQPSTALVFLRGNPVNKGDEVPRQFLSALSGSHQKPFAKGSGRLELANRVADAANPVFARVMVNRVWMHHFGRGLVATPSDFGARAAAPSHPELLDWLALRFIQSGWSLKELHRVIMLSDAYQQTSEGHAEGLKMDPDNRLLWRMKPHRLSFEEARDAWLAASGDLDLRVGGVAQSLFASGNNRRTVYAFVDRESVPDVLRTFDFANPDLSIPQRSETTVPQQALFGMNHPFLATRVAAVLKQTTERDDARRVDKVYQQLFQRQPTEAERQAAFEFVLSAPPSDEVPVREESRAWTYGYGEWDARAGQLKGFQPLPYFNGQAWQGESAWPGKSLGWAQLTSSGGHPGNDVKHAVVRRWTAPADTDVSFTSTLKHVPAAGDGIRAFVVHSAQGLLLEKKLHAAEAAMNLASVHCKKGDSIDFIVDIGGGLNNDQFLWAPVIGSVGSVPQKWDAAKDFSGPAVNQLEPWEQWVQVLMLSNEFLFVD